MKTETFLDPLLQEKHAIQARMSKAAGYNAHKYELSLKAPRAAILPAGRSRAHSLSR